MELCELCSGDSDASRDYLMAPFGSHREYAEVLMALAKAFPDDMGKRGKAERPLLAVLKYGASYRHYAYLQNGALHRSSLTPDARELLPTGTTSTPYAPLHFARGPFVCRENF